MVDYDKCVGCGACAKVCPRKIILLKGFQEDIIPTVACSNRDKAKDAKASCTTSCVACKACSKVSDIFIIKDNLSACEYSSYGKMPHKLHPLHRETQGLKERT